MIIVSCGLRLDDEAVRVEVGLWLDQVFLSLISASAWPCGSFLDANGKVLCVKDLRAERPDTMH